ncbi:MAG: chemotaxis response regulator protein-glutamate methylesterase [Deferrisomatales bacterium]
MTRSPKARVLVVDDSPYTRRVLREILLADPWVGEVDGAGNGQTALQKALRNPPDLVTLDLEMPVMDGFTFLRLFRARSACPVLVVSSFGQLENVEKSLDLGASGFLTKPTDPYRNLESIAEELRLKLRQHLGRPGGAPSGATGSASPAVVAKDFPVIAIGSSSGGPPTLQYLLTGLPPVMGAAVLIAQHMPPGFTESFAKRLDALLPHPVREARHGDRVRPGGIYLGPGGLHLEVGPAGELGLHKPRGELYVPSVDRLLSSAAQAYGSRLTAVILTGMGKDGAQGVRRVRELGGCVIAESRETATVYGMPKEAAATGCVDEILPLPEIAVRLIRLAGGSLEDDLDAADTDAVTG